MKYKYSNIATGKLSDIAGLVFFPLLIISILEVVTTLAKRRKVFIGIKLALYVHIISGVAFAIVKLFPQVAELYSKTISIAMWLPSLIVDSTSEMTEKIVRADATDLIGLSGLFISWWIFRQVSLHLPKQKG